MKVQCFAKLRILLLTLAVTMLPACNSPMTKVSLLKPSEQMITDLADSDGSGVATVRLDSKRVPRSTASLHAMHSVVVHPPTESYLKDLLRELLANVPAKLSEDKQIDVFLTSHKGSSHLYATGADDILVGYGALDALGSRDELAFAMAHEAAHILLGHNASRETIFSLDKAVKLVDKLVWMARTYEAVYGNGMSGQRQLSAQEQKDLARSVLEIKTAAQAIRSSIVGVLHGAWSRGQERDADRLGYDLLIAAGFNGEAAGSLLDRLAKEPSLREDVGYHVDKMEQAALRLVEIGNRGLVQSAMTKVGISTAAKAAKVALNFVDDTHKEAAERKGDLYDDYVDVLDLDLNLHKAFDQRQYKRDLRRLGYSSLKKQLDLAYDGLLAIENNRLPASPGAIISGAGSRIGFNRYAMYRVREFSRSSAGAWKNLQIAYLNRPADLSTSIEYAKSMAARGQTEKALKVVDRLEKLYPADAPLLDVRGMIYATANKVDEAKKAWNECDTHERSFVRDRCERAFDEQIAREEAAQRIGEERQVAGKQGKSMLPTLPGDPSIELPASASGGEASGPKALLDGGLDKVKGLFGQ